MSTDREYLKYQQAGALATSGASDPKGEVAAAHSRQRTALLTSTANAATNVSETPLHVLWYKSRLKGVKLTVPTTNIATSASDFAVINVYKRDNAGANQALIATYNTGTTAVTLRVPASFNVATNTNCIVNANSLITYEVVKTGSGKAIDALSTLDLLFEEV